MAFLILRMARMARTQQRRRAGGCSARGWHAELCLVRRAAAERIQGTQRTVLSTRAVPQALQIVRLAVFLQAWPVIVVYNDVL